MHLEEWAKGWTYSTEGGAGGGEVDGVRPELFQIYKVTYGWSETDRLSERAVAAAWLGLAE